jgi:futalosine hydrolase
VLVVAATQLELDRIHAAETLVCGIGPVEATLATARALGGLTPDAVLNVGIAGSRHLEPGSIVIGTEALYCDLSEVASTLPAIARVQPDGELVALARAALPSAFALPIATSARVGGGHAHWDVEAMEGFGVLRASAAAGVPALELRAISNRFDDTREAWRIDEALDALAAAVRTLVEARRA